MINSNTNPAILWITSFSPFPCSTGLQVVSNNFISALTQQGLIVDMLILGSWDSDPLENDIIAKLSVREVKYIKNNPKFSLRRFVNRILYTLTGSILNFENAFKKDCAYQYIRQNINRWDAILFEGIIPAIICSKNGIYHKPSEFPLLVYRAHNVETDLLNRAANYIKYPWQKLNLTLQASRMQKTELSLIKAASYILAISPEDEARLNEIYEQSNIKWLPVAVDFNHTYVPVPKNKVELLFVGGLYWPPNRLGLDWFLKRVWPKILMQRSDVFLKVVGNFLPHWIDTYKNLERVEFLGYVENLTPLYEGCTATIAPIFYGSGTRIKIIESSKFARACISTSAGIEGSCLQADDSCLLANNEEDWVNILLKTTPLHYEKIGKKAYETIKYHCEASKVANNFVTLLKSMTNRINN